MDVREPRLGGWASGGMPAPRGVSQIPLRHVKLLSCVSHGISSSADFCQVSHLLGLPINILFLGCVCSIMKYAISM